MTEPTRKKKRMPEQYAEPCRKAIYDLLEFFGGNKSTMARGCSVSRNAVSIWFTNGKIGRSTALMIHLNDEIPFTRAQLRPDIFVWDGVKTVAKDKWVLMEARAALAQAKKDRASAQED
jgi:hypothetical protein